MCNVWINAACSKMTSASVPVATLATIELNPCPAALHTSLHFLAPEEGDCRPAAAAEPDMGALGAAAVGAESLEGVCGFDADGVRGLRPPAAAAPGAGKDSFAATATGLAAGVFGFVGAGVEGFSDLSGVLGVEGFSDLSGVLGFAAVGREGPPDARAPPAGGFPLPLEAAAAFAFASAVARCAASVCNRNCSAAIIACSAAAAAAFIASTRARSSSNAL